jgi:hypothetical protein
MALAALPASIFERSSTLYVPRIRYDNNGDEVRRGPEPMRCGLRAGSRDRSERLCQETDESSARYNRRHISSGREVSALRPRRQYGRHTPDGSIRSIFRRSRSAKASLGQPATVRIALDKTLRHSCAVRERLPPRGFRARPSPFRGRLPTFARSHRKSLALCLKSDGASGQVLPGGLPVCIVKNAGAPQNRRGRHP